MPACVIPASTRSIRATLSRVTRRPPNGNKLRSCAGPHPGRLDSLHPTSTALAECAPVSGLRPRPGKRQGEPQPTDARRRAFIPAGEPARHRQPHTRQCLAAGVPRPARGGLPGRPSREPRLRNERWHRDRPCGAATDRKACHIKADGRRPPLGLGVQALVSTPGEDIHEIHFRLGDPCPAAQSDAAAARTPAVTRAFSGGARVYCGRA
jgi:hypothetical protein